MSLRGHLDLVCLDGCVGSLAGFRRPGSLAEKIHYKNTQAQVEDRLAGGLSRIIRVRIRDEAEDLLAGGSKIHLDLVPQDLGQIVTEFKSVTRQLP